ncbi:hypothetical protein IQ07DRAFT_2047 [Pyrenochaeta sp. DS3sAY3a]|nr:hypothetical protein IQ07DRAFT_2047 [Pyrenochaeta sp. DS3sAY3a]
MGYMAKLHYACRYLSLFIDRLKSLRLVKVECSLLCCYVVDVRVVYTHSTPPRNKLQHTVHLRIRSPITLRRTMKPSKLAACSANEILRRQTQTELDGAVLSQFDLEQRAALMSMFFNDNPTPKSDLKQQESTMSFHTELPNVSKKRQDGSGEDAVNWRRHSLSLVRSMQPSIWQLGRDHNPSASSIFSVLKQEAERNTHQRMLAQSQLLNHDENDRAGGQQDSIVTPLRKATWTDIPRSKFRFPQPHDASRTRQLQTNTHPHDSRSHHIEDLQGFLASPASESTLFDDTVTCSLSHLVTKDTHIANESSGKSPTSPEEWSSFRERDLSLSPSLESPMTPLLPLRVRARTTEGTLRFRANAARITSANTPVTQHRSRISLNLPINTATSSDAPWQSRRGSMSTNPPVHYTSAEMDMDQDTLAARECELEYKQRRIFIGAASLDDFLDLLDVSPSFTTTKDSIARAFTLLSSNEQLIVRENSTSKEGWNLVSRVTPDTATGDCVTQVRVKLGSISLRQFLDLVPFSAHDSVDVMGVLEAFAVASHLNAKAEAGLLGGKAKALRRWIVRRIGLWT